MTHLENLPDFELFTLVQDLTPEGLDQFCSTSSTLNKRICQNDNFWQHKYHFDFGPKDPKLSWKSEYMKVYFGPKNWIIDTNTALVPIFWDEYFGIIDSQNRKLILLWDIDQYPQNGLWDWEHTVPPKRIVEFNFPIYLVSSSTKYLVGLSASGDIEIHQVDHPIQKHTIAMDVRENGIQIFIHLNYLIIDLGTIMINELIFNLDQGEYRGNFEYDSSMLYTTYSSNYLLLYEIGNDDELLFVNLDTMEQSTLDMSGYYSDWSYDEINGVDHTPMIIFSNDEGSFTGYDLFKGQDIWTFTYKTDSFHDLQQGQLLFMHGSNAAVIQAETGKIIWTFNNFPSRFNVHPVHTPTRARYIFNKYRNNTL